MNVEPRPAEETYPNLAGFALDPNPALVALTRQCREALAEINRLRVEVERLEQRNDLQRILIDEVVGAEWVAMWMRRRVAALTR